MQWTSCALNGSGALGRSSSAFLDSVPLSVVVLSDVALSVKHPVELSVALSVVALSIALSIIALSGFVIISDFNNAILQCDTSEKRGKISGNFADHQYKFCSYQ